MKTTCIIVEDIQIAADFLMKFCERSGIIDVKGHFTNVADTLQFLDGGNRPDLIFLDVEMPGASGFDLLDRLTYKPRIVLTTSKTEYAFEAFQYNVTDYLKKPFTYNRFMEAMQKIQQTSPPPAQSHLVTDETDHLFIKADEKLIKIMKEEILYIESMRDYVRFVTTAKAYVTYSTLKSMEERLSGQTFIKVHRSYIINIHKIEDIRGNMVYVNGTPIPIGKGHKDELAARLNIL